MPPRRSSRRGVRKVLNHVELEGQEELRAAIARLDANAIRESKLVVASTAEEVEEGAKARVRVDEGKTRDSIRTILRDSGLTASIGSGYFNARFEELGTAHKAPHPFLFPAFEQARPRYVRGLEEAVNKAGRDAGDAA